MTKQETAKILAVLKSVYPQSFTGTVDVRMLADIWQESLADCEYQDVDKAVKAYISTSESNFAPSIGKIRGMIVKMNQTKVGLMTAQEASTLLLKAISNSGYHAPEEFAKLPPVVQRVVRTPQMLFEWSQIDTETLHSVIISNFQRSYQVAVQQEVENAKLPDDLKYLDTPEDVSKILDGMSERLALE